MSSTCDINYAVDRDKHRSHGDDDPVEGGGDGGEAGVLLDLDEEAETGQDEDYDNNANYEKFMERKWKRLNKIKILIRKINPVMMIATKMRRNTASKYKSADEDDKTIYDYIHNDDDDDDVY